MVPDHLVFWALIMGTTNALVKTKHKTPAFGIELNARACQQPLMVCMRSPTPVLLATFVDFRETWSGKRGHQRRTTHGDPTPARAHTRQQQAPRGPAAQGSPSSPAAIWR